MHSTISITYCTLHGRNQRFKCAFIPYLWRRAGLAQLLKTTAHLGKHSTLGQIHVQYSWQKQILAYVT